MAVSNTGKTVRIDTLAAGGDGVGRIDGKALFVPLSAPGDLLRVRVIEEKKSFIRAEIEEILEPGPGRQEPHCPLFGVCGGCQWMHVTVQEQLRAKRRILGRALGLDEADGVEGVDVLASPSELGYRSLARLHWDPKERAFGFVGQKEKKTVDIPTCPVLVEELSLALPAVKKALTAGAKSEVEVRLAAGTGGVAALVESAEPLSPDFYRALGGLVPVDLQGALLSVDGLISTLAGDDRVSSVGGDGEPLKEPVSSFGQANRGVNALLCSTISDWLSESGFSRAIELFAGAGNLTSVVARKASRTEAVELDSAACLAARENIAARGLKRVTVTAGDALEVYCRVQEKFDLVVLDPPRTGHRYLAREIAKGGQRGVLYVSCNPATLERDLKELGQGGFEVKRALGFDMFPHTAHMEAAVMLER